MIAASLAADDASLTAPVGEPTRAGVILATLFTPYPIHELLGLLPGCETGENSNRGDMRRIQQAFMTSVNPLDASLKVLPNLTAGHIAINFGLRGYCRTVSDTCTGGMHAINQAATAIREGELDIVFCGGAEAPMEELAFADLCASGLLGRPAEPPERSCRPFGRGRTGTVAGEGAAVLVLEAADCARRRGAPIRAEIGGFGVALGDESMAGVQESCTRAMEAVMAESGRDALDLLSANGDSNQVNDQAEAAALRAVLGGARDHPVIFATKGAHGSLFSAAGPLDVATVIMAMEHGMVPPSLNCDDPDPVCDLALFGCVPRALPGIRTALVNAIGAFGETASLMVVRAE
jgi:3-oxoacyl-[acyl-carrier-protein] synthase II